MKYQFKTLDFWDELKGAVGDKPVNVTNTGDEITFDFGSYTLTPSEEAALIKLMAEKPMLQGKIAKFVEKGLKIELTKGRLGEG